MQTELLALQTSETQSPQTLQTLQNSIDAAQSMSIESFCAIVIALYLICYILPTIVLDYLQIGYIKSHKRQKAVILPENDYIIAANYATTQRVISIATHIYEFILLICWLLFGLKFLNQAIDSINISAMAKEWLVVMGFFGIQMLLNIPFSIINKRVDKMYGFNTQSSSLFITDMIKTFVIGLILGGILIFGLLWIMDTFKYWWVLGFVLIFGFIILIQLIYPTIIAPLFNKFTPLQNEALENKIQNLMREVGFKSSGIFVMDASKRDGRLNAYFGGLGSSKRVVLFDTLLEKISEDGLLAILGHELGHFKNMDIWRNLIIAGVILFVLFAIMGVYLESFCVLLGFEASSSNIIVLSVLFMPVLTFIIMPISSYFSRKAEYKADEFGANCVSKKALREALVRLVNENKSFPYSHPAYIFFYYSHPPLIERLKALGE